MEDIIDLCSSQEDPPQNDDFSSPTKKQRVVNEDVNAAKQVNNESPTEKIGSELRDVQNPLRSAEKEIRKSPNVHSYSDLQHSFQPTPPRVLFRDIEEEQIASLGGLLGVTVPTTSANPIVYSNLDHRVHLAGLTPSSSISTITDEGLESKLVEMLVNPEENAKDIEEIMNEQELRRLKSIYNEQNDTVKHVYPTSRNLTESILPQGDSVFQKKGIGINDTILKDQEDSSQDSPNSALNSQSQHSIKRSSNSISNSNPNSNSTSNSNKGYSSTSATNSSLSQGHRPNVQQRTPTKKTTKSQSAYEFTSPTKKISPGSTSAPTTPLKSKQSVPPPSFTSPQYKKQPSDEIKKKRAEIYQAIANQPVNESPVPGWGQKNDSPESSYFDAVNPENQDLLLEVRRRGRIYSKFESTTGFSLAINQFAYQIQKHREHLATLEQAKSLSGGPRIHILLDEIWGIERVSTSQIKDLPSFWDALPKVNIAEKMDPFVRLPPNFTNSKLFSSDVLISALELLGSENLHSSGLMGARRKSKSVVYEVKGSMNVAPNMYIMSLSLNENFIYVKHSCDCEAGRKNKWCKHCVALLFYNLSKEDRETVIKTCASNLVTSIPQNEQIDYEINRGKLFTPSKSSRFDPNLSPVRDYRVSNNNNSPIQLDSPTASPNTSVNRELFKTPQSMSPKDSNPNNRSPSPIQSPRLSPNSNRNNVSPISNPVLDLTSDDEISVSSQISESPSSQKSRQSPRMGSQTQEDSQMNDEDIFNAETPPNSEPNSPLLGFDEQALDSFPTNDSQPNFILSTSPVNDNNREHLMSSSSSQGSIGLDESLDLDSFENKTETEIEDEEPFPLVAASYEELKELWSERPFPDWPPPSSQFADSRMRMNLSLTDSEYVLLGRYLLDPNVPISLILQTLSKNICWGYSRNSSPNVTIPEIVFLDQENGIRPVVPEKRRGQVISWLKRIGNETSDVRKLSSIATKRCLGIEQAMIEDFHQLQVGPLEVTRTKIKGEMGKDWMLKLIVDSKEAHKNWFIQQYRSSLAKLGILVEARNLPDGDITWVIQYPIHSTEHYQLPWLIERKSSKDVESTLKDFRYFTQPESLAKLIQKYNYQVVYLIEGNQESIEYLQWEKSLREKKIGVVQLRRRIDTIHYINTQTSRILYVLKERIIPSPTRNK